MNYFRRIIYLNQYMENVCGELAGFAKISQREMRLRADINLSRETAFFGERVYLLYRNENAVNKLLLDTVSGTRRTLRIERNMSGDGEIIGLYIGDEHRIIYGGVQDQQFDLRKYVGAEEGDGEAGGTENSSGQECGEQLEACQADEPEESVVLQPDYSSEGEEIRVEIEEEHDEQYRYRRMLNTQPGMYPFEDDEMDQCVQISPADFSDFPQKYWHMGGNSFLLQGYYNYRHLLFARSGECLYVGIPGQYHKRDRYLADMFGFHRFKGIHKRPERLGDFGYWLKEVE